jgi:hypothetical protein
MPSTWNTETKGGGNIPGTASPAWSKTTPMMKRKPNSIARIEPILGLFHRTGIKIKFRTKPTAKGVPKIGERARTGLVSNPNGDGKYATQLTREAPAVNMDHLTTFSMNSRTLNAP